MAGASSCRASPAHGAQVQDADSGHSEGLPGLRAAAVTFPYKKPSPPSILWHLSTSEGQDPEPASLADLDKTFTGRWSTGCPAPTKIPPACGPCTQCSAARGILWAQCFRGSTVASPGDQERGSKIWLFSWSTSPALLIKPDHTIPVQFTSHFHFQVDSNKKSGLPNWSQHRAAPIPGENAKAQLQESWD